MGPRVTLVVLSVVVTLLMAVPSAPVCSAIGCAVVVLKFLTTSLVLVGVQVLVIALITKCGRLVVERRVVSRLESLAVVNRSSPSLVPIRPPRP